MSASGKTHPFHIVDPSPWPILTSFAMMFLFGALIQIMHYPKGAAISVILSTIFLIYCLFGWWADVVNEGKKQKMHTSKVRLGLTLGMYLFIISEIVLFMTFFASFFKAQIWPVYALDGVWATENALPWPPFDVQTINPWDIPFINTLILLLSGTSVTWAHHAIKNNDQQFIPALLITILLGVIFLLLQIYEYFHAGFGLSDGIYASNFYLATGFHGLHVFVGVIFLIVMYIRGLKGDFNSNNHHLGVDFAIWYWHFVDIVWLFLFCFVYVLGG